MILVTNVDYNKTYEGWSLATKALDSISPVLSFFSDKETYKYFLENSLNKKEKN